MFRERPILGAVGAVLVGALLACAPEGGAWRDAIPHPGLGPDEVVAAQLEALRNNDAEDGGIEVAFRFSSPGNRRSTGPVERFALMIHEGPYELLLGFDGMAMRPVEISDGDARQTVTVVRDGESRIYHFLLSRQEIGDCIGCWMTDSVLVEDDFGHPI